MMLRNANHSATAVGLHTCKRPVDKKGCFNPKICHCIFTTVMRPILLHGVAVKRLGLNSAIEENLQTQRAALISISGALKSTPNEISNYPRYLPTHFKSFKIQHSPLFCQASQIIRLIHYLDTVSSQKDTISQQVIQTLAPQLLLTTILHSNNPDAPIDRIETYTHWIETWKGQMRTFLNQPTELKSRNVLIFSDNQAAIVLGCVRHLQNSFLIWVTDYRDNVN